MITEVTMPKLGLTMDEGTILDWFKDEGDAVRIGEALLSVETDKVSIDVETPASGILLKIVVLAGKTVPLGEVIAYIGDKGEAAPEKTRLGQESTSPVAPAAESKKVEVISPTTAGPIKVSPIARKLAKENQIDLSAVQGTGPQGRIVEADIRALLSARETVAQRQIAFGEVPYHLQSLTSVRKVTAQRMSESFRAIPHFYLSIELSVAQLSALRQQLAAEYEDRFGIHLTYTDLLIRALALNLPRHPLLNAAFYSESDIKLYDEINPGFAIATTQGLVVGVIHHADHMSLMEIAQARHILALKAQERRLTPQDVSGGTFTLTNLGMYGIDDFSPIINPGQSAILAIGAIADRPISEGGQLVLRPTLRLTLAVDHRVADGVVGALFLQDLRPVLEAPEALQD